MSLPFQVDFYVPVVKVTCGDAFSGLLTAEGNVHTWGYNHYGVLGIDQEQAILQLKPDPNFPLRFVDDQSPDKPVFIVDIASGYQTMLALSGDRDVFVWGRRMGIYPQLELTLEAVE